MTSFQVFKWSRDALCITILALPVAAADEPAPSQHRQRAVTASDFRRLAESNPATPVSRANPIPQQSDAASNAKQQVPRQSSPVPNPNQPSPSSASGGDALPKAGLPPKSTPGPAAGPGVPPIRKPSGEGADSGTGAGTNGKTGSDSPTTEVTGPTAILERAVPAGTSYSTNHAIWRCSGTRCETRTLDLRNFYDACTPLAQVAGRVVSFRSRELQLEAYELERCNSPVVREIYVHMCSGRDDLRHGSSISINWQVAGRRFVSTEPGHGLFTTIPRDNCNQKWLRRVSVGPFPLIDLLAFHLTFRSGQSRPTDTGDNWDMKRLIVQVNTTRPGGTLLTVPLIRLEDSPVHRFSDGTRLRVDVPRALVR